jgi:cell wall-associated NlpC family hydrolase
VGLDRDADQQAMEGRSVNAARPGDLFFFGDEHITHTAIATGEREFLTRRSPAPWSSARR